ncbi:hypothetical protein [Shouchella patagoniensis]|uniref:hypothetical protein n=1 Tax=Shouchella patagoniensis TaxID=228576 RepID=UPI000995CC76|nr:hypothetical protein [Shouchella patagoniensis]
MKKVLLIGVPIVVILGVVIFFIFSGNHNEQLAYEDTVKLFEEQAANDGQSVELLDYESTIFRQDGNNYELHGLIWIDFPEGERQTHSYVMNVSYPPIGSPSFKWELEEQ